MAMDPGRIADLKQLDKRIATRRTEKKKMLVDTGLKDSRGRAIKDVVEGEVYNPVLDKFGRQQAEKAREGIIREQNDNSEKGKKIRALRHKLMQAAAAHDMRAERDFAAQINKLQGKEVDE